MSDSLSSRATGGGPASGDPVPTKVNHRPAWIAFVVLGAIFCLGMGFWQLARYQEVSGTVQNLGYTFMWPFLAGFLIYAYLKYVRMEADEGDRISAAQSDVGDGPDGDEADHRPGAAPTAGTDRPGRGRGRVVTEIPADLLPTRRPAPDAGARDEGLDAYNSYLAELARKDRADRANQEKPAS